MESVRENQPMIAQNLSARVEDAIRAVLGAESDELDGPTFDALAYINKRFPDEKSLNGLEHVIMDYDAEIKRCAMTSAA